MRLKGGQLSPTDWGREGEWIEQSFHRAKGREPSILSLTPLFATHLKFAQVESTSKENKASRVASSPEFGGSPWLYIPCQLRVKEQYAPIKGMNSRDPPIVWILFKPLHSNLRIMQEQQTRRAKNPK